MSLSLQESCKMYERYTRRQKAIPSFAAYNKENYTCLPENDVVETEFKSALLKARKAYGMPVTRRLPSLYHKLCGVEKSVSVSPPSAVIASSEKAFVYDNEKYEGAMKMNIRPPNCIATEELKEDDLTLEEYKDMVHNSPLKEAKGLVVHFVPQKRGEALSSLACKLTKNTWEALRGKKDNAVKMKDGTELDLKSIQMNIDDVRNFVKSRKRKEEGPYFIRFSRI
tara:strand:+ start:2218 stop:2892 length:675 start_codon:yes stop_codon:yes gene_type:complete